MAVKSAPPAGSKGSMLLWTRTHQADVLPGRDGLALAANLAHHATTTTALDVVPWVSVFGLPLGTVVYSARVDSHAAIDAALTALDDDESYQQRIADASRTLSVGRREDTLGEVVNLTGSGDSVGNFATVVQARCAPGCIAEATAWGADVLSLVSKVTGLDGAFLRGLYGPWATLVWISLAESMEEIDIATGALAADATYLERVDDAGPLFFPGSASRRLLRRLS
jgi:hypothetical protein